MPSGPQEKLPKVDVLQVFGKDSFLNLGQKETKESQDAWVADMDIDVSSC